MSGCRQCPKDGICTRCMRKELRYRQETGADAVQLRREEGRTSLAFRLSPRPRSISKRAARARAKEKTWPVRRKQK